MGRLQLTLLLVGICITGFLYILDARRRWLRKAQQAESFLRHVQEYQSNGGRNGDTYSWLLRHSHEMQGDMGGFGVMGYFRPPFANYQISNWPIVLNGLSEMRHWAEQDFGGPREQFYQYGVILQEAILRYAGALESRIADVTTSLRNPIIWFRHGVQMILLLPFAILRWLGWNSIPEQRVLRTTVVFRMFSGLASVAAFAASIVTMAEGWDKTLLFAKTWLSFVHR
jgi:hypothetical protein